MKAVLLAAGEGTRLRPLTLDRPKCMVELAGKPLLMHQTEALRQTGIVDITIVTGYRSSMLDALGFHTRRNPNYASTNMVTTLMCAADILDGSEDVLISYADIVYEPRVVSAISQCTAPLSTTVDRAWLELWRQRFEDPLHDAETLKLDPNDNVVELGQRPSSYDEIQGQYMGLIKVSAELAPAVVRFYEQLDRGADYDGKDFANMYMTSFLQRLIDAGHPLRAVLVDSGWLEVDSAADLRLYEELAEAQRLSNFWRPVGAARA